jgi:hypothetical protein
MSEEPSLAHQIITAEPGAQIQNVVQAVITNITTGISSTFLDYGACICNFIEHLSGPEDSTLFWGRKDALRKLDAWLNSPHEPPYLLLAAPAGRGKSALLVRWLVRLQKRDPDLPIAFVPISLRYETASKAVFFAALAARLAYLFGKEIPDNLIQAPDALREMVSNYLRQPAPKGRLLVMLDGLDEATDWEVWPGLFPFPPPEGLRVVVSARHLAGDSGPEGWLRRLGWNDHWFACSLDLEPLTRKEVAEALQSMPPPLGQLGHEADADIVNELYCLSEEGEPLLVRLYLDVLSKMLREKREAAASLRWEDLRSLRPELKSYFDRWLDDQRKQWKQRGEGEPLSKPNVQEVLSLLAAALAPLRQEDLVAISKLKSLALEEAIRYLARLVIGDGKKQGYTFSHPGLRQYFWEKLSPNERAELEKRFLEWGLGYVKRLRQGEVAPDQIPPYLVHALGDHLERSNAKPEDWLHLVDGTWAEAVKRLENSYETFIKDVERAWSVCSRVNRERTERGELPPYLDAEIRCALVKASLAGQSRK